MLVYVDDVPSPTGRLTESDIARHHDAFAEQIISQIAGAPTYYEAPITASCRSAAPDWVLRTSGVLSTKPTKVTVFFMMIDLLKLFLTVQGIFPLTEPR